MSTFIFSSPEETVICVLWLVTCKAEKIAFLLLDAWSAVLKIPRLRLKAKCFARIAKFYSFHFFLKL